MWKKEIDIVEKLIKDWQKSYLRRKTELLKHREYSKENNNGNIKKRLETASGKSAGMQEQYMERLCGEYAGLLDSDKPGSERFWDLWERIRKDRKHTGVIIEMTWSKTIANLLQLLREGVIPLEDLNEFSEKLQMAISFFYCKLAGGG